MLTLQKSDKKPKFNPWKPLVWAFDHPYWAWLLICVFGWPVTFALSYVPVKSIAIVFAVITVLMWVAGAILITSGAVAWIVEGGFEDIGDWVRERSENHGKVEDKERAFKGKEYTY